VPVPPFIHAWLRDAERHGDWGVAETGLLVTMLEMFVNEQSLLTSGRSRSSGRFERDEHGELTLVVSGGWQGFRLPGAINPDFENVRQGGGRVREREGMRALVRNDFFHGILCPRGLY
jgi:hypothetical protein